VTRLVVILRCWTRLDYEGKKLPLSEYFAWIGWIFALGWFITSTMSMLILAQHPPIKPDFLIPNVDYLKVCEYESNYEYKLIYPLSPDSMDTRILLWLRNLLAKTLYSHLLLLFNTRCLQVVKNNRNYQSHQYYMMWGSYYNVINNI
jgi:hypothetical protein